MDKEQAIELLEHLAWDRDIDRNLYEEALNMAIDALKTQLSQEGTTSDLISRQAAIEAVMEYGAIWMEYTDAMDKGEITQRALNNAKSTMIRILKELPSVQPERAIPLSWIENEIKWLKSLDNTFSEITALQISAMVNKWRDEQNETD